jgi:two-component system, sensor histidine kinase and response regulator
MKTSSDPNPPPEEILIAEDSPTQAQRLRHILEKQGYHVTVAGNGRLALEAARERKPALVISDVIMPEMDGYELCRQLKDTPHLGDVPLILVTTLSDPQDVIRGLECRADNFIIKPYEERYLLSRVQFVLLNREMHRTEHSGMGVEIYFNGQRHFITADRLQILNLLLSTYEAAIQRNKELTSAQESLRQLNVRLEESNRELETFSYSVSHDLRAPLRHIQGYTEMLTTEIENQLSEKARRFLKIITTSSQNMNQLIDDLLAFSRMGRVEMRETVVSLEKLVSEGIANLEMATRDRDIVWKITPLPAAKGDPALLRQVFANLLSNAVKYTRKRTPAEIEIGFFRGEAGELTIFVRDNGVGFDMEFAGKLFGVFQRLHRAEDFEGTGVGLANVRRIIARHGGRVWAESVLNQGATFYFTLRDPA